MKSGQIQYTKMESLNKTKKEINGTCSTHLSPVGGFFRYCYNNTNTDHTMTGLPKVFQQTSDGPYDRHKYQIFSTSGESAVVDDYMVAQATWFQKNAFLSHIVILDKQKKKQKKGF